VELVGLLVVAVAADVMARNVMVVEVHLHLSLVVELVVVQVEM
tara:strand:- start:37 stop:165 length:129 start_codon:yes stop_codon:yes gene_type:complete